MADTPYLLPRQTRESDVLAGNGTVGPYGPSLYKVFDTVDVKVFAKALGQTFFSDVTAGCTIAKVNPANAYDYFTVTFGAAVPATTAWYHQARRVAERSVAVTKGGTLDSNQLEKELSKQASAQSEMRRDLGRAWTSGIGASGQIMPSPEANKFLGWNLAGTAIESKTAFDAGLIEVLNEPDFASDSAIYPPSQRSTAQYIAARRGLVNAAQYGASPSNTAAQNDAAFDTIDMLGSAVGPVFLDHGTYLTNKTPYQLTNMVFAGPGKIKMSGYAQAPTRSFLTVDPGDPSSDRAQVFDGLTDRTTHQTYMFVGAAVGGVPGTTYRTLVGAARAFSVYDFTGGHNTNPADHALGRTGAFAEGHRFYHGGQGDLSQYYIYGEVYSARPSATHFLANPAISFQTGGLAATGGATGAYLQHYEILFNDGGLAVAVGGHISNYVRTNAGNALGQVWVHDRPQGTGTVPADAAYTPAGLWKRGLDFAATVLDANKAAIALKQSDRIYWNASGTADLLGIRWFCDVLGTVYSDYDGTSVRTMMGGNAIVSVAPTVVTFTQPLVLPGNPSSALQAATKQYVDNVAAGLDVKPSARAATTANITLSGAQTIDGISVIAGDRVAVKNQTAPAENGIYVAAAGAWTRATDMDVWSEVPGANVWVEEGTINGDTAWVATANAGGTIGTTAITWSQFGGTGAYQASSATLSAFAAYNTNGILTQTAANTFVGRTLTGTANELTVTNGSGVSGNPTISLPTALTFTGKTVTGGTFNIDALSLTSATTFSPAVFIYNTTVDANAGYVMMRKGRNGAAVAVSDALGTFLFQGLDSTGTPVMRNAAYLTAIVENVSAGAVTARFELVAGTSIWQFKTDNNLNMPGDLLRGGTKVLGALAIPAGPP